MSIYLEQIQCGILGVFVMPQLNPKVALCLSGKLNYNVDALDKDIFIHHLTLLLLNMTCLVLANSVDPDQLASEEAN